MVTAEQAKKLLALHGEVRPQPPTDWTGTFPLPAAVERFYQQVGPFNISIEEQGNPYFLPGLADLWQFQTGYRWNGLNGEPIENWNDDWLVVTDEGGDPFIFLRSTGAVLHAFHGEGEWNPGEMFPADLRALSRRTRVTWIDASTIRLVSRRALIVCQTRTSRYVALQVHNNLV